MTLTTHCAITFVNLGNFYTNNSENNERDCNRVETLKGYTYGIELHQKLKRLLRQSTVLQKRLLGFFETGTTSDIKRKRKNEEKRSYHLKKPVVISCPRKSHD
jgi:hypothetical protein